MDPKWYITTEKHKGHYIFVKVDSWFGARKEFSALGENVQFRLARPDELPKIQKATERYERWKHKQGEVMKSRSPVDVWVDSTSYSKDQKDRIPYSWSLYTTSGCRLVLTKMKTTDPSVQWRLAVYGEVNLIDTFFAAKDLEQAQRKCLTIMARILRNVARDITRLHNKSSVKGKKKEA